MENKYICRITDKHDWYVEKFIGTEDAKIFCIRCKKSTIIDKIGILMDGLEDYKVWERK